MRARQVRLFSTPDFFAAKRDLGPAEAAAARAVSDLPLEKPEELTWWDWAVFLLHTAAEIEHALMVQYLYAAYSLADDNFQGPSVPTNASQLAGSWRARILGVAREEMAHLLTIQNLLRFIGAPLNFEREDLPFRAFLYPFVLQLEPLSKTSIAKYVAAEMPEPPEPLPPIIDEIVKRATGATGGMPINRVGKVYDALVSIFGDETKLQTADLRPETATAVQGRPDDWFGVYTLLAYSVATRQEAIDALEAIAAQGEGSTVPLAGGALPHFDRFLAIYKEFPETDERIEPVAWMPTRPVPVNPNTLQRISNDAELEAGRITHPTTRLWAHLFNVHYRMLLLDLAHALHRDDPYVAQSNEPTIRGRLRDWTFLEMRGNNHAGLRGIGRMLTTLPLKDIDGSACAGPPFELPYTLALPDNERDRWRLHLALLDTSRDLVAKIVVAGGDSDVLSELSQLGAAARVVVEAQLSG